MGVSVCSQERPLGLFEVLARNRQSALGLCGRTLGAQEKPNRMFTIPPRQRLPFTRWLAIRKWRVTRIRIRIITCNNRQRERHTQTKALKNSFLSISSKKLPHFPIHASLLERASASSKCYRFLLTTQNVKEKRSVLSRDTLICRRRGNDKALLTRCEM